MIAPQEIRLSADKRTLTVVFPDHTYTHTATALRVNSPSAEVQGHGPGQRRVVTGKEAVTITAIAPMGTYAVQLEFSDGHRTGIYTWDYLRQNFA